MKAMVLTSEQRKAYNEQVAKANRELQKQVEIARREAAEAGIAEAQKWLQTDGIRQMFLAVMKLVYYTLHIKRPGKGFDSKRGIISFHNDLIQMMNENLEEYNFKSDDDAIFVCDHWLKELGVEVDELPAPISFVLKWD